MTASLVLVLLVIAALVADNLRVAHQRDRAEANLGLAREAVHKFLVEAGIADFEDAPLPPPARQELLLAALTFYENNDPDSLRSRSEILHALQEAARESARSSGRGLFS